MLGSSALDSIGHRGVGMFVVPAGMFFVWCLVLACSSTGTGAVGGVLCWQRSWCWCCHWPHIVLVGASGVGMSVVLVGSGIGVGGVCAGGVGVSIVLVGSGAGVGGIGAGAGGVGVDPFTPLVYAGVVLMCPSYPPPLSLV